MSRPMSDARLRVQRRSGVLLHLTSLPGPSGSGDLGPSAVHFVDWLVVGGQSLWQMLPLGVTGPGHSPYMSPSAFAGNPLLIDLAALRGAGWLEASDLDAAPAFDACRIDFSSVAEFRMRCLRRAAARFFAAKSVAPSVLRDEQDFAAYCAAECSWLDDYALFMALAGEFGDALSAWPSALRQRESVALRAARARHAEEIAFQKFTQWCFDRQWAALRNYAQEHGVELVGDLPIFVAANSADVWANPELFDLDASGAPRVVAGVPPDYFSATGQHWGNPLYRWDAHAASGYAWWIARLRRTLRHCHRVRIDHFRGFVACWEIPAAAESAIDGRWVKGPGAALFTALAGELGDLNIIAEDLGIITADITALRRQLGYPGMRVLQFAFDGKPHNPYLPHNYDVNSVAYTGTHDNDTTCGWWNSLSWDERARVAGYFGRRVDEMDREPHWEMIRAVSASVAEWCIVPMQDALGLDGAARMNRPGDAYGAWGWRFTWDQVGPEPAAQLAEISRHYGRSPVAWAMRDADADADAEQGG